MERKTEDLTGQKFGKLTVLQRAEDKIYKNGQKRSCWLCQCDCGNKKEVVTSDLKSGGVQSCGCKIKKKKDNFFEFQDNYVIGYDNTKKNIFFIDKDDFEKIKKYYWRKNWQGYWETRYKENEQNKIIKMHRFIKNLNDPKIFIDHINHNKNDNRKCNLRMATPHQNSLNRSILKNNSSEIIGVSEKKPWGWIARINFKNKYKCKIFKTKEEAIAQRKKWEDELFGEFSYNNSINICSDIEQEHDRLEKLSMKDFDLKRKYDWLITLNTEEVFLIEQMDLQHALVSLFCFMQNVSYEKCKRTFDSLSGFSSAMDMILFFNDYVELRTDDFITAMIPLENSCFVNTSVIQTVSLPEYMNKKEDVI